MIPDKPPQDNVFHGSEELKKEAHVPSFDKYRELYMKSVDNPDGESPQNGARVAKATPVTPGGTGDGSGLKQKCRNVIEE